MKRNLKFWTRYTWECTGMVLAVAAVLAVIAAFGAEGLDLRALATVVPYFLCIGAVFCIMVGNSGTQTLYVPLLLSMGETRRNVLLGFHYFRALIIAVMLALCAAVWLLAPGDVSAVGLRSIPTILCVLVIASAMGSIMGTVFVKWKWVGMILIILLCGLGGSLDVFAGVVERAPKFWSDHGLEWFYRLCKNPWRAKRMMKLPLFLVHVRKEKGRK